MRKIFSILIISLLLLNTSTQAQEQSNYQKAKKILDKVSEKTKTFTTIKATFTFEMLNQQENIDEKTVGTIWMKGSKYKLNLLGIETYCDGKYVWSYNKDDEEVTMSKYDPDDDEALNPSNIFNLYKKGFKYSFVREMFKDTRALYVIDLIPTNFDGEYSKIRLTIDKDKSTIYSMTRYGNDGNIYVVKIKNLETNKPMNDNMFIFDTNKHPGVELIDDRD